jgi:pimeloyl-ACP methyl ester carboxylesterase
MDRRLLVKVMGIAGSVALVGRVRGAASPGRNTASAVTQTPQRGAPFLATSDGTRLYVQDFGAGRPIVFLSAWALDSRFWGSHMVALAAEGFRTVAFDRRGHGRSDAPSTGYDADTLAKDLATVLNQLDLKNSVIVAHSIASGEAVRYLSTLNRARVSKLLLVAPTTPYITKTDSNPEGVPVEMVTAMRQQVARNFPAWVHDNEAPFFTADTDPETRVWLKTMMLSMSLPIAVSFRDIASRTDFRDDLRAIEVPTLIIHGDKDVSAPLALTGARTQRLLRNCLLSVYEGAPHALPLTHRDRFLADVAAFSKS